VQLLHSPARTRAVFDDPNLLAHVGLAPLLALAGRAGLPGLLAGAAPAGPCGANPATKAMCLVAGMSAGADSIDDMDLLRDGAMETVFGGVLAPSTLGSFLRSFAWGNVRQLDRAHRGLTAALAADPRLLPGREVLGMTITRHRPIFGYQDQHGHFEIVFDNVRVPAASRLAGEGDGFMISHARPGPGRIHHAMRAIGMAERALSS